MQIIFSFLQPTTHHLQPALNQSRFFECGVGAVFLDGFYGFGGESKDDEFVQLGNENPLFLHISVFPDFSGRIELRGASAVAVTAGDKRAFFSYWTDFCHVFFEIPTWIPARAGMTEWI